MILGSKIAPYIDGVWGCEFVERVPPPGYLMREAESDDGAAEPGSMFDGTVELRDVGYVIDNTTKTRDLRDQQGQQRRARDRRQRQRAPRRPAGAVPEHDLRRRPAERPGTCVTQASAEEPAGSQPRQRRFGLPRPSLGAVMLALVVFVYAIREILPPFVIAAAIAYIVFPAVAALERRLRWPRVLIVLVFYLILVGVLVAPIYLFAPRLIEQAGQLREAAPRILDQALTQMTGSDRVEIGGQLFTGQEIAARLSEEV